MQRYPSMEDQFTNSPNSLCRHSGASTTPNCLKPTESCQTPSSALKENLAANKPKRGSFLKLCSTAPLYPKGSDKPADKFRLPPRPSPPGTRGCARTGGQHRRPPGSPRAGSRAQPRGTAAPRAPRAAEPRPCGSPPRRVPGPPAALRGHGSACPEGTASPRRPRRGEPEEEGGRQGKKPLPEFCCRSC